MSDHTSDANEPDRAYINAYDYDANWRKEREKKQAIGENVEANRHGELITLEELEAEENNDDN